ncbi:MAG: chromate resistance protein [Chloroflexota bacterium]|nr:chromate resistance protein [Chloroflexota bacterium]
MKWITREHPHVDRVACPWLIERFVDKEPEFIYVPSAEVMATAERLKGTPYDVKDVDLGHHGLECSFDAFVHRYGLDADPALAYMAKVIRGADTADKTITLESLGVEALLDGVRELHYPDDQAQREASVPVLEALYAYCRSKTKRA